jgi:hypothetical protein
MIIRTNKIPFGWRGIALRWVILIKPDQSDEVNIIAHERIHVKQQKDLGALTYFWKYCIKKDPKFIASVEYDAFRYGNGYSDYRIFNLLIDNYNIPKEVAREAVSNYRLLNTLAKAYNIQRRPTDEAVSKL